MAVILFGVFIALLLLGVPVAFAICSAAATTMFAGFGDAKMMIVVQRMFASCDSFSLIAVPFFIFAGDLLAGGRISKVLVEFCESLLGMIKGGLSVVSVLAGMFFAAISGSGAATTAAVGATLVPELKKRGYREDSAAALVAAAGTIGVVIPPSVPMVLYAVIAEESVSRLFSAGFLPGVIMGVMLIAIALCQAYQNNYPKGAPFSLRNVGKTFLKAIPGILMPAIILGGIFSGYFTPTEAAAVAVFYSLIVGIFVYRELKWKDIVRVMTTGIENLGLVMLLMASGKTFAWVLGMEKVAERATEVLFSFTSSPMVIMLLINLLLLFMGTFMETNASILILTPILMPIVTQIGVHPVQFGVIMIFALMIGLLTPPMAICLFLTSKLGGISFQRAFKAVTPYYIGLLIVLLLINVFPQITLAVPKLLLGSSF